MAKKAKSSESQENLVPLLEFIYQITSLWTETLEKYNDLSEHESKNQALLYECIYFFLYVLRRISYNKLPKAAAEELHQAVKSTIIIGIVNFLHANNSKQTQDRAKLDFFSHTEMAELEYMKTAKSADIVEENATPIIHTLQKRIAKVLGHESDDITKRIKILTENLYIDFLDNKLLVMEKLVIKSNL